MLRSYYTQSFTDTVEFLSFPTVIIVIIIKRIIFWIIATKSGSSRYEYYGTSLRTNLQATSKNRFAEFRGV